MRSSGESRSVSFLNHSGGAFLDLAPELSDPATARLYVLPIPHEVTTSYIKGTLQGPAAILEASSQVELYDEAHGDEPCRAGIHTLPPLDCSGTQREVIDRIRAEVSRHVASGRFVLALGGEHTVTIGCVDGAADAAGPLTVVQVDAHGDLRDEYDGTPFSHACVMRRLVDRHPAVQIGIRALSEEEAIFAEERGLTIVTGLRIADERARPERTDGWISDAVNAIETERVYLTFDLDGLDPSVVPGVGTPEPGGLLWNESLAFLEALFSAKTVVAADVVELCPIAGNIVSDYAAARLAYKIAGHALRAARS